MAENVPLINQHAAPDANAPAEAGVTDVFAEADALDADLLEDELEELVIEDFTIDGICGVY